MSTVIRKLLSPIVFSLGFTLLNLFSGQVLALDKPTGPVVLTVTGLIENTNVADRAEFDYDMLVKLGMIKKEANTIWTPANSVFEGISTTKLMEAVDARGSKVRAVAIDDYVVHIPIKDLTEYPTLLATHRDGQKLTPRDHGPLWIIYDDVDRPADTKAEINSKMIWQLTTLIVE